ncbi:uncharacterized protein BKCO1_6600022 [Diplodia corticola]|uniref:Uncharacterized protein n=1 Tax=Diplodia corticola TaxID=236234 RepID=A0A1J9QNU3_9PEZI|nr:uncharacterized protein BKCO1_6600022 [Diplodia corticola]OJD30112.1 hypothetical protein BKCO1_6600022 [Diplodia corticola]
MSSRGLVLSKSRSQILRPLSPVLDAVSRLLRPSSAQSTYSKTGATAAWISNDFTIPPSAVGGGDDDDCSGDAVVVPVMPSAPQPPRTPDEDNLMPVGCSSSPSTCGSTTSSSMTNGSNGNPAAWTTPQRTDAGIIKRRRLRRYHAHDSGYPSIMYAPEPPHLPHHLRHHHQAEPRTTVLEKIVLELFDVQRLDWMMIAEPLQRLYGLDVDSAAVLGILQDNGRVQKTMWFD